MQPLWRWIWVLVVSCCAACAQHYPILPVPGSPRGITALFQDSRSAIWIGTNDDVVCFDGRIFYSIHQYGLPRARATGLAEDSDGGIWISIQGTTENDATRENGLYRYQHGKVDRIFSGRIRSLVSAVHGSMLAVVPESTRDPWNYGDLYIFRKEGNDWQAHKLIDNFAIGFTVDRNGSVLFPCPEGWCEISRQQILAWPRAALHPHVVKLATPRPVGLLRVLRDRFNCIWFRGSLSVSYQCPNQPLTGLPDSVVGLDESGQISEAEDGSLLTVGPGLSFGRPGSMHVARTANGLPGGGNIAILGHDGTIFIGSETGLYRFMYPFRLEFWGQGDGVDNPFAIARIGDRVLSANSGIRELDATRTHWNTLVDPKDVGTAVHLLPGPDHTFYVASLIRGVTQFTMDGKVLAHSKYGPGGARLASDGHGRTWLAGTGVTSIAREGSQLLLKPVGASSGTSLDLEYDSKRDALWACLDREVVLIEKDRVTHLSQKDGLEGDYCRTVAVMSEGDVWVAYGTATPLSHIHRDPAGQIKIDTYPAETDKENGAEVFLDPDSRGWLWRASLKHDYVATPDAATKGDWLSLDGEDGIPAPGGNQNCFFRDDDGSVWFASEATIVHFTPPDNFVTRFPAPELFMAGMTTGAEPPALADAMKPAPHGKSLIAHIGSLQFDRGSALHLRYRLLPDQPEWKDADSFDLQLGKLGAGEHTLEFQGRLLTGEWSSVQSSAFHVLWPMWFSWPVLLMAGAGGSGIGLGVAQWRKRQKAGRELTLPDISAWRMGALAPEAERLVGSTLDGRYEIGHILSVGGFVTVARARDLRHDGQLCAVKIFRYELSDRAWIRHRFEHEVAALEQLSHPNIVKITGHGTVDTGAPYLVMEFIHGQSVRQLLENGALPAQKIARFLQQLANALSILHQRSIYHRDIKPENLMVRLDAAGDEQIVLIDFSIAIVKAPDRTIHGISRVAGTMGYMAPEQVTGYADASTDIHSLAKLVLELMTGLRCAELLPEATLDLPKHVGDYFSANPGALKENSVAVIASALAFDPAQRPRDVMQFAVPLVRDLSSAS
jgi:hypothetical protein